ncbi:MAG: polysaccharide biosynthesis tyrosine autokinase [Thermosynechococcaceae cyanobacterium MS004]|nr:polysaccharide biosynthesis tyrosine autokinase [Thermosynechococcaceae cyanobacterium MS004]
MEHTEEYIDLKQYWQILRRRWLPAVAVMGSVTALTAALTFLQKPVYQAEGKLLLRKESGLASSLGEGGLGALEALTQKTNPISTEIEIIRSEPILRRTIQSLQLKDKNEEPLKIEDFLKSLSISNSRDTDVIVIAYKDTDKPLTMAVVNQLIEFYRQQNVDSTRTQAASARRFIESQLPQAERDVKRYEAAIRDFKERSKVVSLPDEAKVSVESIGRIQEALTNYQGQLADASTRAQALRNQLGFNANQGLAINALSQSPAVQKALTDLQEVDRNLATLQTQLQPGHPQIQDLKKKQTALNSFLKDKVGQVMGSSSSPSSLNSIQASQTQQKITETLVQTEVQRLGLENQVSLLRQAQLAYRDRVTVLPRLEQLQRELERQLKVAQTTYEALLTKLQEVRIAENQNVGNVEVIAPAILPDKPISPKILLNLAIGTVMGLLLGVGTALLLEALDNSVKTVKEAQNLFDLTVLGTIPTLEGAEKVTSRSLDRSTPELPVRDDPRSAVSEAFRMLQANLKFLSSDAPARTIAVTSSVPQEGKSTTSANLALVLAEMGHRVLIVDADLRRPSQHQIWELPNAVGLSNVLVEPGNWTMVVRSENEHLDVMTAGVIPPNPVRLLDSHRMVSLIKEWRQIYDYVIIDCPPLAVASDALLVGQFTDGLLMVARPGVVNAASAEASKAALEKASGSADSQRRVNVLGLVLNGVIPENEPDSYYYYYAKDYYSAEAAEPAPLNGKSGTFSLQEDAPQPEFSEKESRGEPQKNSNPKF